MTKAKFEVYKDVSGKFRFRLRAPNNRIVALGEGYNTKTACLNGVNAIKEYNDAEIEDLTTGYTTLILDIPPNHAKKDSTITFTGKLISDDSGEGVAGATIAIYDENDLYDVFERTYMEDDHMVSGETRSDGTFSIQWKVKEMDWWDNTVEVYAKFRGTTSYKPSKSNKYTITVS